MTSTSLAATKRATWLLALAGALLLAACSGGYSDGSPSSGSQGTAPASAATQAITESTQPAAGAAAAAVEAAAPRTDGLTGAPVPHLEAHSAEFDASRLNEGAGRFPPLDDPTIVSANAATWLDAETLVLGAVQNGEARAYPIAMMTFHHVANDVLGGEPYLVTF